MSRYLESFVPRDPAGKSVGIDCYGSTDCNYANHGNFRIFVFADLLSRYFRYRNYDVTQVMNVTDGEGKIIARVSESRIPLRGIPREKPSGLFRGFGRVGFPPSGSFAASGG